MDQGAVDRLAAAVSAAFDPVERLRAAALPVLTAQARNGAAEFRFRGERLADGRVKLRVTNCVRSETWTAVMDPGFARQLAAALNESAG